MQQENFEHQPQNKHEKKRPQKGDLRHIENEKNDAHRQQGDEHPDGHSPEVYFEERGIRPAGGQAERQPAGRDVDHTQQKTENNTCNHAPPLSLAEVTRNLRPRVFCTAMEATARSFKAPFKGSEL
jgi:hypothetical protein